MASDPRTTCDMCQQWVKAGEVHSCYSEFDWRRVAQLERAVVEKAEAYADMLCRLEWGDDMSTEMDGLVDAVRALRAERGR